MKLIIENFPPITKRSEIDLSKKFTVFVGDNNAGKTYVSELIWGIYNAKEYLDDYLDNFYMSLVQGECLNLKYFNYVKSNMNKKKFTLEITDEIIDYISDIIYNFIDNQFMEYISNILEEDFVDKTFKIKVSKQDFKNIIFQHASPHSPLSIEKKINSLEIIVNIKEIKEKGEVKEFFTNILVSIIIENLIRGVFQNNLTFLPASRTFFAQFYKYIYTLEKDYKDKLIKNIKRGNINPQNINSFESSYTKPTEDIFNKIVFELDKVNKNKFLDEIEKIIEGKIDINIPENIGMSEFKYEMKNGEKLPLHLSSSMVNQLTLIYLYFKHWIKDENNFLIIDEPEINLHPKKVIELLELLLKFSSENSNKVLLTTHSPLMAEALINYILMFNLKENNEDIEKLLNENNLNMDSSIDLKREDIGIYYFNGDSIVEYESDEFGLHFGTFTKVKDEINKIKGLFIEKLDED